MRPQILAAALTALSSTLVACDRGAPPLRAAEVAARPSTDDPPPARRYGRRSRRPRAGAHVRRARSAPGAPVEAGVALDEGALDGCRRR